MSHSTSLNTALFEVIISSRHDFVIMCGLCDLKLQIIVEAVWDVTNVGSKWRIYSANFAHTPSCRLYLHCGIDDTGSPGIICIVWDQVPRHPWEHATSSLGKLLVAQAHIANINELTVSEITQLTCWTVDEPALPILIRQASGWITIVGSQKKIIYVIWLDSQWPKWQTKHSKWAAKMIETSEFHQNMWNRYLMLGFVSADIPRNTISNLQSPWSYVALRDDLLLPSVTTVSNSHQREYALPADAIMTQVPLWHKVS